MTKQLLTALLIAGISATAKAERVLLNCTSIDTVELTEFGAETDTGVNILLDLHLEKGMLSVIIDGELATEVIHNKNGKLQRLSNENLFGQHAFEGNTLSQMYELRYNLFAWTQVGGEGDLTVVSHMATCVEI